MGHACNLRDLIVNDFQGLSIQERRQLDSEILFAWQRGRIACGKSIASGLFISECDQLARHHKTDLVTIESGGLAYAMANNGLPLGLDQDSLAGRRYRDVCPQYRINHMAWQKLQQGLSRG